MWRGSHLAGNPREGSPFSAMLRFRSLNPASACGFTPARVPPSLQCWGSGPGTQRLSWICGRASSGTCPCEAARRYTPGYGRASQAVGYWRSRRRETPFDGAEAPPVMTSGTGNSPENPANYPDSLGNLTHLRVEYSDWFICFSLL